MNIKNVLKTLFGLFSISFFVLLLGVTFVWRHLDLNSIKKKIENNKTNKEFVLDFHNLEIKKSFPYLIVKTHLLNVESETVIISISNFEDKISIAKYVYAYILGKQYYGKITAENADIEIKSKNTSNRKLETIPILPLDVQIDKIYIKYINNTVSGRLKVVYIPLSNRYSFFFNGKINKSKVDATGNVSSKRMSAKFFYDIKKIGKININSLRGKVSLVDFDTVVFKLSTNRVLYKAISIDNARLNGELRISNNSIIINNIKLTSSNSYNLEAQGILNTKDLLQSDIKGCISTPFVNIQPIINRFAPNSIKDYVLQSTLSLKNVEFKGHPSLEFIRWGAIIVRNSRFRLDKKSSSFFIKDAKIVISEQLIDVTASGNFERIAFKDSKIQIHRTKGYPCDMNLSYQGNANDLARIFLEENIFSKKDLLVLGKSKKLKGNFSATTVIKDYRWGAKPYFFFDINIHSNGIELFNENVPSKFVKSWGDIQIKREVEYKQTKRLFIRFKNLKLIGLSSRFYTQDATLNIQPRIKFDGKFKAYLSKDDFNYLERAVIGEQFIRSKVEIDLFGSLKGYIDDFYFKGEILSDTKVLSQHPKETLKIKTHGHYKDGMLYISALNVNKNLNAKGNINMKKFYFNLDINTDNFNISSLNGLVESPFLLKGGLLSGKININGNRYKPIKTINGDILIHNGYFSKRINSINASIKFNRDKAYIKWANLDMLNNRIDMKGFIDFKSYMVLDIKANNFVLDIENLKSKGIDKTVLKIPKIDLNITAKADKIILKNKNNTQISKKLIVTLKKRKDIAAFNVLSNDTRIIVLKEKRDITVDVKDYIIMPLLTDNNRKDNLLSIQAKLTADKENIVSLESINGSIDIQSINGEFKEVSDTLKLLSATNIIEIILGKTKLDNNLKYDKIVVNLSVKNGVIKIRKNGIAALYGKSLNIFAQGSYNIIQNYINVYITFTTFRAINTLISHIPVMGWIVGGKERSFSGVSLRVNGYIDKKVKISAVPLESLGKGFLNMLKRTITLPFNAFGVAK